MSSDELNIYNLTRNWWNFCFENPHKVKPVHTAIYFFAIEHCNRLAWKENFGLPTSMAMEATGIKSYNTYINALNQIIEWGFIVMVEKSRNQYSSNIIALSKNNKAHNKALDKALLKHSTKHCRSTVQSTDSINIPNTNIPITNKPTNGNSQTEPDIFTIMAKDRNELLPNECELLNEHMIKLAKTTGGQIGLTSAEIEKYINDLCTDRWAKPSGNHQTKIGHDNLRHDMQRRKNNGWLKSDKTETENTYDPGALN